MPKANANLFCSLLLALGLLIPALADDLNQVTLVRIGQHGDTLRLVLETEKAPVCQVYQRSKPERLVIDLVGAELPDKLRRPTPRAPWLLSSNLQQENLSRVRWTLNLRERIPSSQIKTEVLDNPPRLVVDIDPYYAREETIALSAGLKWTRREAANSTGYLLWNDVSYPLDDPKVRLDVGLAQDRLDARETVSSMVRRTGARVGINGGYFATSGGPLGLVVKEGKLLAPHVGRRPPRTALAQTRDRKISFSRIAARGGKLVSTDGSSWTDVLLALGGGPQLVHRGAVALTTDQEALGRSGNDITRSCGRTALATTRDGRLLLATAAGWRDTHTQGLRLEELSQRLIRRGAVEAMNLDGGASVDMVIGGDVVSSGPGSTTREKPVATAVLVHDEHPATYPERIQLTVEESNLPADGSSKTRVVALVTAPGGQSVPDGTPIRFLGDRTRLSAFATTVKDGRASVELTSLRLPGPGLVKAECGGARAEESVRYLAGTPRSLRAGLVGRRYQAPGQVAVVAVQVDDEWGNPVGSVPIRCAESDFQIPTDGSLQLEIPLELSGGTVTVESAGLGPVTVTVGKMEAPLVPTPAPSPKAR